MVTGVFKDRSAKERSGRPPSHDGSRDAAAEQALADLLSSRELRAYALSRNREVGPFSIEYLFPERSLIVELTPTLLAAEPLPGSRQEARRKFLNDMGYRVLGISCQELLRQPQRVLAKLRMALEA